MTDTNTLFQEALANAPHHVASHTLPNGDVLFCMVDKVAGRSIVRKHIRTTWGIKFTDAQYQKPISRVAASSLLREGGSP